MSGSCRDLKTHFTQSFNRRGTIKVGFSDQFWGIIVLFYCFIVAIFDLCVVQTAGQITDWLSANLT